MTKTYVTLAVLVLVVLGGVFLFSKKSAQAPESAGVNTLSTNSTATNQNNYTGIKATINPTVKLTVSPVREFTIVGQNYSFTPSTITVRKGDKVRITFKNTNGFHDFKIDEFGVAGRQSQSPSEEVLEFTADKTGTFQYYCSVGAHRAMGMWGTLQVE